MVFESSHIQEGYENGVITAFYKKKKDCLEQYIMCSIGLTDLSTGGDNRTVDV